MDIGDIECDICRLEQINIQDSCLSLDIPENLWRFKNSEGTESIPDLVVGTDSKEYKLTDTKKRITHVNMDFLRDQSPNVSSVFDAPGEPSSFLPDGLCVISRPSVISHKLQDDALKDVKRFFGKFEGTQMKFLGMPLNQSISQLQRHAPALAKYTIMYIRSLAAWFGLDAKGISKFWTLSINGYNSEEGLLRHIDSIERQGDGPLMAIALGQGYKCLDLFPTLIPDKDYKAIRLITRQGECIVMDGSARYEWSHCVPRDEKTLRFTLAIKSKIWSDICCDSRLLGRIPSMILPVKEQESLQETEESTYDDTGLSKEILNSLFLIHDRLSKLETICDINPNIKI